ncbi:MAG: cell division protein ZapA [Tannerellaceae bacterium]|jgi:cell division protein ZapA|nr:cell division protein ZapA [Tannerellaceae bacterium]
MAQTDNKFLIHIDIADKQYPLWIERTDEELARNAAKQVKAKYIRCRNHYAKSVEERDLLAMVAFQLSKENLLLENRNDTTPYAEVLKRMVERIDACLDTTYKE